jgi:hypothetical protein
MHAHRGADRKPNRLQGRARRLCRRHEMIFLVP